MTLADVCDELEAALEHERGVVRDWWAMQRLLRALVALGELRVDYAIEAGSFYGSDGEQRHGARWDALNYDRFASLKAQAKEVLGGS